MFKNFAIFLVAAGLQASPITYSVLVNTSSISGQSGNIDFQFNPGNTTADPAFVTISAFASNGTLVPPAMIVGGVTGTLPGAITIRNTGGLNDYTEGFTFGGALSFLLRLDGPALTSPSGTAKAGSSFALSLFNSSFSAALLSTNPDGFLLAANVDTRGNVTTSNFGAPGPPPVVTVSAVPEPALGQLVLLALAGLAMWRKNCA